MSTVTLSKPHCAITSAENPEGIASQAFTTALPEAQTVLTLFAIARVSLLPLLLSLECCRSNFGLTDGPLDARLADADFAGGVHYRRPGIVRQGHAVFGAVGPRLGEDFRCESDEVLNLDCDHKIVQLTLGLYFGVAAEIGGGDGFV